MILPVQYSAARIQLAPAKYLVTLVRLLQIHLVPVSKYSLMGNRIGLPLKSMNAYEFSPLLSLAMVVQLTRNKPVPSNPVMEV